MPHDREVTLELLDYRVSVLEVDRAKFLTALESLILMGETLRATRDTMDRLSHWIETVDKRVQSLEVAAPILQMTSRWVVAGVIGVLSLVGMGFYGMYDTYRFNAQAGQQWPQSAPADAGRKP